MTRSVRMALLASVALVAAGAAPTGRAPFPAAVIMRLTLDSISGVRGVTSTVAFSADMETSGKALGSYAATISWDSTVIRLDSVRAGVFGSPLVNYVNGGEVRLTQVNMSGQTGAFTVALLHFRFANDTVGKRSTIQLTVSDLTATDFTDLRSGMTTVSGVARILPPTVIARFSPDSIRERVGFKPQIDLTADLTQATGISLGSYAARITWDSTVMRLDSVRSGDYAAPQLNQVNAAELRLAAADAQGRGAAFSLGRLFFRFVDESFPRESALGLTVTEIRAALSFADLLPGISARNGKALIGGVLRGDIDVSGTVAALDAQLILQGVVGLSLPAGVQAVPHGDADCNAVLRARDAQIVLNLVVGNDVSQFCAGKIQ